MKTSPAARNSATSEELSFTDQRSGGTADHSAPGDPFVGFEFKSEVKPDFARRAGRMNASSISSEEEKALLQERQALLDKKFAKTITPKDSNRLAYVRWSLDRISDAKHGTDLDALEAEVGRYERFAQEVLKFEEQLRQAAYRRSK